MNRINPDKVTSANYLSSLCERIYTAFFRSEDDKLLKSFEREIWMVGSELLETFKKNKKISLSEDLLEEILKIIEEKKYGRGRESFVMLLHYFKNKPQVEHCLSTLLEEPILYGFAIGKLQKLKLFSYLVKVQDIFANEKKSWIRQAAKKYIEKATKLP